MHAGTDPQQNITPPTTTKRKSTKETKNKGEKEKLSEGDAEGSDSEAALKSENKSKKQKTEKIEKDELKTAGNIESAIKKYQKCDNHLNANYLFKKIVQGILLHTSASAEDKKRLLKEILDGFDIMKHVNKSYLTEAKEKSQKHKHNRRSTSISSLFGTNKKTFANGLLYDALKSKSVDLFEILFETVMNMFKGSKKTSLRGTINKLLKNVDPQLFQYYQQTENSPLPTGTRDDAKETVVQASPQIPTQVSPCVIQHPFGDTGQASIDPKPAWRMLHELLLKGIKNKEISLPHVLTSLSQQQTVRSLEPLPQHPMALRPRRRQINYAVPGEEDFVNDEKINLTPRILPARTTVTTTLPLEKTEKKIRVKDPSGKEEKEQVDLFAKNFIKDPQNTHRPSIHFTASQSLTALYNHHYIRENKDPKKIFETHPELMRGVIDEIIDYYITLMVKKYSDVFIQNHIKSFLDTPSQQASTTLLAIFNRDMVPGLRREIRAAMVNPTTSYHLPKGITSSKPSVLRALQELYLIFNSERGQWMDPKSTIEVRLAIILGWQAIKDTSNLITPVGADVGLQQAALRDTNLLDAILHGIDHCSSGYINGIPNTLYKCHKLVSMKHFSAEDLPQLIQDKYNAYYKALALHTQQQVAKKIAMDCLGNKSPLTAFLHYEHFFETFSKEMKEFVEAQCFTLKQLNDSVEEFCGNLDYLKRFPLLNEKFTAIQQQMLSVLGEEDKIQQKTKTKIVLDTTDQPLASDNFSAILPNIGVTELTQHQPTIAATRPTSPKSPRIFQPIPPGTTPNVDDTASKKDLGSTDITAKILDFG